MYYLLALLIAGCILIFGLAWFNESQATRIKAEAAAQATIIRAESDARFRDSQSTAITMAAALPMVIVIVGGCVLSIFGLALVVAAFRYQPSRPQIIERIETRTIVYLPSGAPRRELWAALSSEPMACHLIVNKTESI